MRKIFIGADSAGYGLKEEITEYLFSLGDDVTDCGTNSTASCHYPDYAKAVCENVQRDLDGSFGILICGTGIGMSMCANKHKGIRAALCGDTYSAKMTRLHNDANVLCMGARVIDFDLVCELTDIFLSTDALTEERHLRRQQMISDLEDGTFEEKYE